MFLVISLGFTAGSHCVDVSSLNVQLLLIFEIAQTISWYSTMSPILKPLRAFIGLSSSLFSPNIFSVIDKSLIKCVVQSVPACSKCPYYALPAPKSARGFVIDRH